MLNGMLQKVSDFFGVDTSIEADTEIYEEIQEESPVSKAERLKKSKVVQINPNMLPSIEIMHPSTFEEASEIVTHIQNRRIVLLKIDQLTKEEARRVVDFSSGAATALLGEIRKLSADIFVINPNGVSVLGDLENSFKSEKILKWTF